MSKKKQPKIKAIKIEPNIPEATEILRKMVKKVQEIRPDYDEFHIIEAIWTNMTNKQRENFCGKLGLTKEKVFLAGWIYNHFDELTNE